MNIQIIQVFNDIKSNIISNIQGTKATTLPNDFQKELVQYLCDVPKAKAILFVEIQGLSFGYPAYQVVWLVVEPTHLKNMLIKLKYLPQIRGENKKDSKPPPSCLTFVGDECYYWLVVEPTNPSEKICLSVKLDHETPGWNGVNIKTCLKPQASYRLRKHLKIYVFPASRRPF